MRGPRRSTGPSLLEPGAACDPYLLYRVLREEYPLSYDAPLGAWLVSRYADVVTALTDSRFTGLPHDTAPRGAPAPLGLCHGDPRCASRDQPPAPPEAVPGDMSDRGAVPRHMPDTKAVPRHMPALTPSPDPDPDPDPGPYPVTRHTAGPDPVPRHMWNPASVPGRMSDPTPVPHPSVPRHTAARIERTAYVLARRIAGRQQVDLVEEFCRWLPLGAAPGTSARRYADRHSGLVPGTTPGIARSPRPPAAPATAHATPPAT
ncbi:hypothetical protein AADR41_36600, partial [Streptomyces sp. CLV115]